MVFRDLLDFVGINLRRVTFSWVSAAEGAKWAELVNQATNTVRELGPYKEIEQLAAVGVE
jgi:coenzyme F420-reducing hydrogenase delta subunit